MLCPDRHRLYRGFRRYRYRNFLYRFESELLVDEIPGQGHCPACGRDVALEYPLAPCPECGQAVIEATRGRELRVKSINVD